MCQPSRVRKAAGAPAPSPLTAAPWGAVEIPDSAPPGRLGSIPSAHGVAPYGMGGSFRPLPALCGVGYVPRSVLRALAPPAVPCLSLSTAPVAGFCLHLISPAAPPAPAAPAGGSRGARGLRPGGSRPRPAFGGPPHGFRLLPHNPGLTFRAACAILFVRGPFRSFGGCPLGIHGRQENRSTERPGGFFMLCWLRCCRPKITDQPPRM